ncbi:MAG: adenylyltransferase/cytidyltransferase family protein [Chitinivibrionales bacterium]|nr:adenylyltransferase/cytidyltransferase family protein [Chitinivibrionales bacterium]
MTTTAFATPEQARDYFAPLRRQGKSVVTTNGCFDIVHAGHIRYLIEAAAQGDLLAVGINADATVRQLKGVGRPIQRQEDRALLISSLKMVACAFIFADPNPIQFIEIIRPDVHVKGGDYPENIIEKPAVEKYGGKVKIVAMHAGYSTSKIVRRIQG